MAFFLNCVGLQAEGSNQSYYKLTTSNGLIVAVCSQGLFQYSQLQKKFGLPDEKYAMAAQRVKKSILSHMLRPEGYFMGNSTDTAQSEHEHFDAGCNDYILKPIDLNDLKGLIRKYSENRSG